MRCFDPLLQALITHWPETMLPLCLSDTGLSPYSEYQYSLVAVNGAGRTETPYSGAITLQTLPEGVNPPTAAVEADQLDTIYLSWEEPEKLNGDALFL